MALKIKQEVKAKLKQYGINYHDFMLVNESSDNLKLQHRKTKQTIDVRY